MKLLISTFILLLILIAGCDRRSGKIVAKQHEQTPAAPQQEQSKPQVEIDSDKQMSDSINDAPKLTGDKLPDGFPETMTDANSHIWIPLVTVAAKDPEYLQKILPDNADRVHEIASNVIDLPIDNKSQFLQVYWQALAQRFPDTLHILHHATFYMNSGPKVSHEENHAFISLWEHIIELCDEQNIPTVSPFRKTRYLPEAYVAVGEYDKAIRSIIEQRRWIDAIKDSGLQHRTMYHGLSTFSVEALEKLKGK